MIYNPKVNCIAITVSHVEVLTIPAVKPSGPRQAQVQPTAIVL